MIGALPLTGCLAYTVADVDGLNEERGGPGWSNEIVIWCLSAETAARAREHGWPDVREISEEITDEELVEKIAGS